MEFAVLLLEEKVPTGRMRCKVKSVCTPAGCLTLEKVKSNKFFLSTSLKFLSQMNISKHLNDQE